MLEVGREVWALELKASRNVSQAALRGLRAFSDFYGKKHHPLVLYLGEEPRRIAGVDVMPWQQALKAMGL